MKNVQPFVTIDYRDTPPTRELKMYEVGETVFACVLEDCDWTTSVPIFQPPENMLAGIFGAGQMKLSAEHHHNYEAERILEDHYRKHTAEDFIRTVVTLREEIDVARVHLMAPAPRCDNLMIDTGVRCDRRPDHIEHDEMHAGTDEHDNFHTWR